MDDKFKNILDKCEYVRIQINNNVIEYFNYKMIKCMTML